MTLSLNSSVVPEYGNKIMHFKVRQLPELDLPNKPSF